MTPAERLNAARTHRDRLAVQACQDDQWLRQWTAAQAEVVTARHAYDVYLGVLADMQRGAA